MIGVANFVSLPLMFLSTILISRDTMPDWIHTASQYNPVDWGAVAARNAVVVGGAWGSSFAHLGYLLALTAVTAGFATWALPATSARSSGVERDDPADHLAARDRLARCHRQLLDDAGAEGVHLVLHLHRLDDAEHAARLHLVALGDLDGEHRSLHRADDGVRAGAVAAGGVPLAAPPGELAVAAAPARAGAPRSGGRRPRRRRRARGALRPRGRATVVSCDNCSARWASSSDSTTPWHVSASTKHGARAAHGGSRAASGTPPISNSSSARSIRRRACSRSTPWTISFAIIGSYRPRDRRALFDPRVDADPRARRLAVARDPPRGRQEPPGRILGVDPAFDRVPVQADVFLAAAIAALRPRPASARERGRARSRAP